MSTWLSTAGEKYTPNSINELYASLAKLFMVTRWIIHARTTKKVAFGRRSPSERRSVPEPPIAPEEMTDAHEGQLRARHSQ